jgi:hypothetical protein
VKEGFVIEGRGAELQMSHMFSQHQSQDK